MQGGGGAAVLVCQTFPGVAGQRAAGFVAPDDRTTLPGQLAFARHGHASVTTAPGRKRGREPGRGDSIVRGNGRAGGG